MKYKDLIKLLIIISIIHSCKYEIRRNYSKIENENGKVKRYVYYFKPINIFNKSLRKIEKEIKFELNKNPTEFEKFKLNTISVELYCDTTNCSVKNLEIEFNKGFIEISKKITDYLNQFKYVNCYDKYYNQKISHYRISFYYDGNEISVSIGYGYRIRSIKS